LFFPFPGTFGCGNALPRAKKSEQQQAIKAEGEKAEDGKCRLRMVWLQTPAPNGRKDPNRGLMKDVAEKST